MRAPRQVSQSAHHTTSGIRPGARSGDIAIYTPATDDGIGQTGYLGANPSYDEG